VNTDLAPQPFTAQKTHMKEAAAVKKPLGFKLQPAYEYADELRMLILTPRGVRHIARVIQCFTLTCIVLIGFLPVLKSTFSLSNLFVALLFVAFALIGWGLFFLSRALYAMKRWALFSFWALCLVLFGGYLYRIELALHMRDFVLPIVNIFILLSASTYLVKPTVRARFIR
jgi:hypothetical protein